MFAFSKKAGVLGQFEISAGDSCKGDPDFYSALRYKAFGMRFILFDVVYVRLHTKRFHFRYYKLLVTATFYIIKKQTKCIQVLLIRCPSMGPCLFCKSGEHKSRKKLKNTKSWKRSELALELGFSFLFVLTLEMCEVESNLSEKNGGVQY